MRGLEMGISWETRRCTVNGELGYFHIWEQYSQPMEASILVGGAPAGVFCRVYGLVEFSDGVRRVDPESIKFVDEENQLLEEIAKWRGAPPDD